MILPSLVTLFWMEAIIPQGLVYHNCTLRHFPAGNGGTGLTGRDILAKDLIH